MKFNPAPERVFGKTDAVRSDHADARAMRKLDHALLRLDPIRLGSLGKAGRIDNDPARLDRSGASIMPSTIGRATHSTTQSGLSGISASDGTQGRPSKVWYFGLIANTLPLNSDMLDSVRSPNDPRVSDAPTTATTPGLMRRVRSAAL